MAQEDEGAVNTTYDRGTSRSPFRVASSSKGKVNLQEQSQSNRSFDGTTSRSALNMREEESPLIPPRQPDSNNPSETALSPDRQVSQCVESEETKSTWYLILLTSSIGGLQIVWSVELSSVSPFLLSLGLSKSLLALVWIAGPLSGTLVQPYVGIRSDNCRSRFGRRRPFMVGGAIATGVSLLALSWSKEIVVGVLSIFGAGPASQATRVTTQVFAVLVVYILDFAINVVQAAIRAFIVDCTPTHQQEDANAWASRITGVGNIIGYLSGFVYLPNYLPFLGDNQFKVLVAIACIVLASTLIMSCLCVGERDSRLLGEPFNHGTGVLSFSRSLIRSVRRLSPQIRKVCQVQIFAWIGWFPFLFYTSTYVGGIYAEPFFAENPNMTDTEIDMVWERGTRLGSLALLTFAIATFTASVVLPWIITPSYRPVEGIKATALVPTPTTPASLDTLTPRRSEDGYFAHKPVSRSVWDSPTSRFLARFSLSRIQIPYLTLRRAWLFSHLLFALLTWCTLLVRSTIGAIVLVGAVGIPWALTNWAPFALIAAEISKRDAIRRGLRPAPRRRDGEILAQPEYGGDPSADQAGVVLGIHNVAIAAPQVVATLVSSVIFKFLQKPRGATGDNSIAWVLRFGGLCALGAAWMTRRVGEGEEDE